MSKCSLRPLAEGERVPLRTGGRAWVGGSGPWQLMKGLMCHDPVEFFVADPLTLKLSCASLKEFIAAYNALVSELPPEVATRLSQILTDYSASHGIHGAFERMANQTVTQIISAYSPSNLTPHEAGEIDGLRWEFYERPASDGVGARHHG